MRVHFGLPGMTRVKNHFVILPDGHCEVLGLLRWSAETVWTLLALHAAAPYHAATCKRKPDAKP